MKPKLKPLDQQVVVLTGATSGIGLATARKLAQRDATVFAVSRNEDALRSLIAELEREGARAGYHVADVGVVDDVQVAARACVERFGRIDSWINDAGVSIFGNLWEQPIEEARRLFDTNYWGEVYGSLTAVEHMRENGGALINVGSVLSDYSVPLQGQYVAAKHAVKGFTNSLRMELMHAKVPISVTLIKPSAIATPFAQHAANHMDEPAKLPPPYYAPELVADAIAYACEHVTRELTVGSAGRAQGLMYNVAPWLSEPLFAAFGPAMQKGHRERYGRENLDQPGDDGRERGQYGFVRKSSLYLEAQKRPVGSAATLAGLTVAALGVAAVNGAVKNELKVRRRVKAFKARQARKRSVRDLLARVSP